MSFHVFYLRKEVRKSFVRSVWSPGKPPLGRQVTLLQCEESGQLKVELVRKGSGAPAAFGDWVTLRRVRRLLLLLLYDVYICLYCPAEVEARA